MIRFGPAGIPLSCKGRTVRDGVMYTRALELDAIEIQFARGVEKLAVEDAEKVGDTARELNVELHTKAPYYINLAGDENNVEMSMQKILGTGLRAHIMGAQTVIFHAGFYGEKTHDETLDDIVKNVRRIRNIFIDQGWTPRLAIEITGKRNIFGTMEEVLQVCKRVKGVIPVIDLSHIHARGNGILQEKEDFEIVFKKFEELKLDSYLIHFSGIMYENGNGVSKIPIKKSDLKFDPLCEYLLEKNINATILSTSPILEHDAMYMNIVWDRVRDRREQRVAKEAREIEEAKEKSKREEEKRLASEMNKKEKERKEAEEKARKEAEKAAAEAAKKAKEPAPQCSALTLSSGEQCKNPARPKAKFCNQHKGWRGKTTKDLPQNQTPQIVQSDDSGRRQVQVDEYKLYKKDNRFYFMKKKRDGFGAVFKVPEGKEIRYNKDGVPTIRNIPPVAAAE